MKKVIQILWGIFLFTFPFSIRFVVYEQAAYRFGDFNPFVTGFVYLPEILLIATFILWLIQRFKDSKIQRFKINWSSILLLSFLINAGVMSFLVGDFTLYLFFLLRVAEAGMVYLLIRSELLPVKTMVWILLGGATFQLLLGYAQWKLNHSVGLARLGEAVVSPEVKGVAKVDLADGAKQIRPYGTFLHPNILAAYLMTILFVTLPHLKKSSLVFWLIALTGGVFFTHSRAAALVTLVGFGLIVLFSIMRHMEWKRWVALSTLIIVTLLNVWFFQNSSAVRFNDVSWHERLEQNILSRNMFLEHPFGVGLSNYTLELETVAPVKLKPWDFQPVHNTYFLILNEVGIQGLLILLLALALMFYFWEAGWAIPLLALILIAPFDHFLWDSFAGLMLLGIVLGFFRLENES